ncbi:fused signal recognition particle receptor [Arboricoccus pini]|uniref:Signal recognition particle receptor FtsY n=1 Tax=Arboricoccus pini TaxID=1963835 RepID=A0A212QNX6_9PROT|nr:signal recognition particle-docking protein FtsY [Arboricoccus pini]SNB60949.1 fused signal recognition particle receptor [Arboricoccus pini]
MSETEPKGWFARLRGGLQRSSSALTERIAGIFTKRRLDDETLEQLEDALIISDIGVDTSRDLVRDLARGRYGKELSDIEVKEALAGLIAGRLEKLAEPLPHRDQHRPQVVLVCGVNGTGKTTTLGKLAKQATEAGLKVVLAACDTFRAAAVEQLQVWGERNGVPVIAARTGSDPAALAYEALDRARREGADLLMIDTAGRLHNKQVLMEELKKIIRVIKKLDPSAPHDTILILDATTGQNAHSQVDTFKTMVDITGLIVTKLDGTARAGVVVAIGDRYKLPVHAIGIGEKIDDLRPFEALPFARALMGLDRPS